MFVIANIGKLLSSSFLAQGQSVLQRPVVSRIRCRTCKRFTNFRRNVYDTVPVVGRFYSCSRVPSDGEVAETPLMVETAGPKQQSEPFFISRAKELAEKAATDLSLTIENVRWTGGKLVVGFRP